MTDSLFTDEPLPKDDLFTDDPPPESFINQTAKNVIPDIGNIAKGLGETIKEGASDMPKRAIESGLEMASGTPYSETPSGQKDVEFFENAPEMGEQMARPVTHPIDYFKEHPVQQSLNVLGAVGALKWLRGNPIPKTAEVPPETIPNAKAEPLVEIPKGTAGKSATMEAAEEFAKNLPKAEVPPAKTDPLKAVNDYLAKQYGKTSKTPGISENLGQALEQKARGMRLKEIGGSPGQLRQLRDRFGEDLVNNLSDLAEKKGITKGFFNFQTGKAIKNLSKESGQNIGALRDLAVQRGAIHNLDDLIGQIKQKFDPQFMSGSGSSQRGAYLKALQDLKKSAPDAHSIAQTITDTNNFVKKNRLTQPLSATTDVMNEASRLNNELIKQFLNKDEATLYDNSLHDFAASKIFNKMYGFTYGRDMAGRSGPANILNVIKDIGGRKIMEKVFSRVGKYMQKTPDALSNPKALSAEVLDSVDNALDEIIQQMGKGGGEAAGLAHGGLVDSSVNEYLKSCYAGSK